MLEEMKTLIEEILYYNNAYYNENQSLISDHEYDTKFDRLQQLERETGIIFPNSPTVNVGAEVVSKLNKVEHNHPMLSLDKTKDVEEIKGFIGRKEALAMLKMDGLTITLTYRDGILVAAETRGNGIIGENVLHNIKHINNIPMSIPVSGEFIVDGEAIIDLKTFEEINSRLIAKATTEGRTKGLTGEELEEYIEDNSFKNARNLASGTVRQLDSNIAASRNAKFIAWKSIKGIDSNDFCERLAGLSALGFDVVPYEKVTPDQVTGIIEKLRDKAKELQYPIDGIVFSYNDVAYGEKLGATTHHLRSQIAFKFYDDEKETTLRDVEWSMGRTGVLTPVAVFEPVELEGTTVERASLHNVSLFKSLELGIGDSIAVYKANMIIPQISDNFTRTGTLSIPVTCPVCGEPVEIIKDKDTEVLMCINPDCQGKLLNKISNFVSRQGMNINGLSKKSIEKLISIGVLKNYLDIYHLKDKKTVLMTLDGFGKKKVTNLLEEIENSKKVTLDRFLCALGIPGMGSSKCRKISRIFHGSFDDLSEAIENHYNFSSIEDFGPVIHKNIYKFWSLNAEIIHELAILMEWEEEKLVDQNLKGKSFVITGKLQKMSRAELKSKIESLGGKVSDTVSKNTSFLINNDSESSSSKNKKAKELNVPIITEEEVLKNFL